MVIQISTNHRGRGVTAIALLAFATITVGVDVGRFRGVDLAASHVAAGTRTPIGVVIASALRDLMSRRLIGAPLGAFLSTQ